MLQEPAGSSEAPIQTPLQEKPADVKKEQSAPLSEPKPDPIPSIAEKPAADTEVIETLPAEVTSSSTEDDDVIFTKADKGQPNLTNIAEEEEAGGNKIPVGAPKEQKPSNANTTLAIYETGNVKLSDILGPPKAPESQKSAEKEAKAQPICLPPIPLPDSPQKISPEEPKLEGKVEPTPAAQPLAADQPSSPAAQSPRSPPSAPSPTQPAPPSQPPSLATQPDTLPAQTMPGPQSASGATQPAPDAQPVPVAQSAPTSQHPQPVLPTPPLEEQPSDNQDPEDGKKKKGMFTKILEIVGVSPKEKNGDVSKSVFYDVESPVPVEEATSEMPAPEPAKEAIEMEKKKETQEESTPAQVAPSTILEQKKEDDPAKPVEKVQEKPDQGLPSAPADAAKVEPQKSEADTKKEQEVNPTPAVTKEAEKKETKPESVPADVKTGGGSEPKKPEVKEVPAQSSEPAKPAEDVKKEDKKAETSTPAAEQDTNDKGKAVTKPARNLSGTNLEKKEEEEKPALPPKESKMSVPDGKKKAGSPKVSIPQDPLPGTTITMPTPEPTDVPVEKRDFRLLNVDDTILETPPVTEGTQPTSQLLQQEANSSTVKSEVDNIIDKAKKEVESKLQEAEKAAEEVGEDVTNTLKMIGDDKKTEKKDEPEKKGGKGKQQPSKKSKGEKAPPKKPEEVEELKVTSEEERQKHKGQVTTSKLSDQILKAIPPPRRKAISDSKVEGTGGGSKTPPTTPLEGVPPEEKAEGGAAEAKPEAKQTEAKPEAKQPEGKPSEGKSSEGKSSKSTPVPPPRNKPKASQPPPPKGKTKK